MSEQLGIGKPITGEQYRDAIHVPVMPIVLGKGMEPGTRVYIRDGKAYPSHGFAVGVIDPFLDGYECEGVQVWLFLFPGSIKSLRHDWTHATIDAPTKKTPTKEESEAWLREFVKTADCPNFDDLITAATGRTLSNVSEEFYAEAYTNDGEYLYFAGRDAHGEIPPEFWDHVENYTGIKICQGNRAAYFSCSC